MEQYYILMFTMFLFLVRDIKAFLISSICLSVSVYNVPLGDYLYSFSNINFFESCLYVELFSLLLVLATYPVHRCKQLILIFALTSIYNILILLNSLEFKEFLIEYFKWFNIIMFEYMLFLCIINTKIKDWLDKLQNKIADKFKSKFSCPRRYVGWKGYL